MLRLAAMKIFERFAPLNWLIVILFICSTIIFELHTHRYPFQNLDTRTYVSQLCSGHRDDATGSYFQDSMRVRDSRLLAIF